MIHNERASADCILCLIMFLTITCFVAEGQPVVQTIKGSVTDKDSHIPLPGATIMIIGSEPVIGTVSDLQGNFRLTGVPVGRQALEISYVGYEPVVVSEIQVISGKEVILQVTLKESATSLEQVEVKAFANKDQAVNSMGLISARQLTMEEASRYAGGIDDPARLASSFAGVAGSMSSNAIVIRGNAPKGLLWRMEGVEIPNPSHFANVTTFGGGGITALSSQMLTNSDFFTGAFPAEYGNALSGVFDMKMRTGNNEKSEHTIKAGIIGLDFASEGPFVKGKKASYLFNYRYSTLSLISPLLPENARGIGYQDLAYKIYFPAGKNASLVLWGLLSTDKTGSSVKTDTAEWQYYQDIEEDANQNRMGAIGINHRLSIRERTYLHTSLSATGNYISWDRRRLNADLDLYPVETIKQINRKYALAVYMNHKFSATHTNRTGIILNRLTYDVNLKQSPGENQALITYADENGGSNLFQFYSQSRFDINPLVFNMGYHTQVFTLSRKTSFEPRLGIIWKFHAGQTISLAYGLHSRLEPIGYYLAQKANSSGLTRPNKNLALTRSHHLVLGYEKPISIDSRLRIEAFYQQLFDVPVIPGNSFSMINLESDWFFNDSLSNEGSGTNIGLDITMEKFLHNGYYYLFTVSLFDSKYSGGDGILRNSRFNKNYVVNLLAGKEWKTGRERNNVLGINGRFSLLGGDRISPVDNESSQAIHDVVYDESRAFENREPAVYFLDFTASWQINKPGHSSTWSFQFVNLLFQKEFYGYRYNFRTHTIDPHREAVVIPNFSYRIDF
jgi:hypothetical protein